MLDQQALAYRQFLELQAKTALIRLTGRLDATHIGALRQHVLLAGSNKFEADS